MPAGQIHVGDYGTALRATMRDENEEVVDISETDLMEFNMKKPDGNPFEGNPELDSDGTDGKIRHVLQDGDIDQAGTWQVQARVRLPSGHWYTDIYEFEVYENL